MFRILVSVREKRSTATQFENVAVGCDIEADNLELNGADAIVEKTSQLFVLARSAVRRQILDVVHERREPHHADANGHAGADGNGRSYGRPDPSPTPKQRVLLHTLATERGISAEEIGEIARREFGRNVPALDRHEMSLLLERLMAQDARP
jgi:hypothetical protein